MESTEQKKQGFDFNAMDNKTKYLLIASLVGIISCFLPIFSVNVFGQSFSASLFEGGGYGYFIFLGFLGVLVFNLMGEKLNNYQHLTKVFIASIGALWGFLLTILMLASWTKGVSPEPVPVSLFDYLGIGFYLTSASIIVLVFAGFSKTE